VPAASKVQEICSSYGLLSVLCGEHTEC